jgi:hypothetical protein
MPACVLCIVSPKLWSTAACILGPRCEKYGKILPSPNNRLHFLLDSGLLFEIIIKSLYSTLLRDIFLHNNRLLAII